MADMPVIPLYVYQSKHLHDPRLKGMPFNLMDSRNWKHVYFDPQAAQ